MQLFEAKQNADTATESLVEVWQFAVLRATLAAHMLDSQTFNGLRDGKMWDVEQGEIPGTVAAASQTLAWIR